MSENCLKITELWQNEVDFSFSLKLVSSPFNRAEMCRSSPSVRTYTTLSLCLSLSLSLPYSWLVLVWRWTKKQLCVGFSNNQTYICKYVLCFKLTAYLNIRMRTLYLQIINIILHPPPVSVFYVLMVTIYTFLL